MKNKVKRFFLIIAIIAFAAGGGFLGKEAYNTLFEGRSEYAPLPLRFNGKRSYKHTKKS